jgi:predicted enzyme related to lactoylglutathione lyase
VYLEIPAVDVEQSAEFCRKVFGWEIRRRGDGELALDDTVGEVSGTWCWVVSRGSPVC